MQIETSSRAPQPSATKSPPLLSIQSKEEVMAVRLREADSMASMAELRQKIAELEIQVCVCIEEDDDEDEEK